MKNKIIQKTNRFRYVAVRGEFQSNSTIWAYSNKDELIQRVEGYFGNVPWDCIRRNYFLVGVNESIARRTPMFSIFEQQVMNGLMKDSVFNLGLFGEMEINRELYRRFIKYFLKI